MFVFTLFGVFRIGKTFSMKYGRQKWSTRIECFAIGISLRGKWFFFYRVWVAGNGRGVSGDFPRFRIKQRLIFRPGVATESNEPFPDKEGKTPLKSSLSPLNPLRLFEDLWSRSQILKKITSHKEDWDSRKRRAERKARWKDGWIFSRERINNRLWV